MSTAETIHCGVCNGTALIADPARPGYQQPSTFAVYKCNKCGSQFCLPQTDVSALYESIYKNGPSVPGYSRYWKYKEGVRKAANPLGYLSQSENMYWGVEQALASLKQKKSTANVLEVGSGLGYLTYSLHKAGYNIKGLDISSTAVAEAKKSFGDMYICADLFEYAEKHAAQYDIVVLTEVIEHVEDPVSFIGAVIKLLKPGGHAIVTTPNRSFYPEALIWHTESPPVHYWWFTEDAMKNIAAGQQSSVSFVDFKGFYKKNYQSFSISRLCNMPAMPSILNAQGQLLSKAGKQRFPVLHSLLNNVMPVKKTAVAGRNYLKKLKERSNTDILVCGKRGTVMCAIFEKNGK